MFKRALVLLLVVASVSACGGGSGAIVDQAGPGGTGGAAGIPGGAAGAAGGIRGSAVGAGGAGAVGAAGGNGGVSGTVLSHTVLSACYEPRTGEGTTCYEILRRDVPPQDANWAQMAEQQCTDDGYTPVADCSSYYQYFLGYCDAVTTQCDGAIVHGYTFYLEDKSDICVNFPGTMVQPYTSTLGNTCTSVDVTQTWHSL